MRIPRVARLPFPFSAPTVPGSVEPLAPKRNLGADYDSDWARRFPARFARTVLLETLVRPAVAALGAPERDGIDRLAGLGEGPVIFAGNHHSHLDTPVVLTSIPEPWRYKVFVGAAADYFFRTRLTSAASALVIGAIPIERSKVTRRSADQAAALIADGWSMLIFPEGGRSPDGWGQPFRGGAAYLSSRCDVPVVPLHIEGTAKILRKGAKRPTPAAVRVTYGTPLHPEADESASRYAERIERSVAELADEATTDWWQARQRAGGGHHPAPHRTERAGVAASLGPRRPLPEAAAAEPRLAQALMGRWSRAALAVIVIALLVAGIALVVTEVRASDADDGPSASRLAADRECVETDAPSLARLPTAKLSLTEVGTAVEPTSAVFVPDGSGDGLLSERNGRVLRIEGGTITDEVVLDLTDDTMQEGDGGLLALAYDAGAEWLYAYRADASGDDVLTAYPLDDAGAPARRARPRDPGGRPPRLGAAPRRRARRRAR